MKTCMNITYCWIKSTLIWICVLLHNLRGCTVDSAPMSLFSLSNVVAVGNSPVSNSPKEVNTALLSNRTSSFDRNNTMDASSPPEKPFMKKEISSVSDLNFTAKGRGGTLENPAPVKPLVKKLQPVHANIETVLNITEGSFYDLSDFQNDSKEYDPLFLYKTKRGLVDSGKNTSEVRDPQTSNVSDFTSSPTLGTETTILPLESETETKTTPSSGSDAQKDIDETTTPSEIPIQAANTSQNEPIKSTQPKPSTDKPNEALTHDESDVNETTMQSEHIAPRTYSLSESKTEVEENPGGSDNEMESEKNNVNTTGTDNTPIVEYENDPKWYGNPKTYILDDYEVFKLRGCADFSCKHDFE